MTLSPHSPSTKATQVQSTHSVPVRSNCLQGTILEIIDPPHIKGFIAGTFSHGYMNNALWLLAVLCERTYKDRSHSSTSRTCACVGLSQVFCSRGSVDRVAGACHIHTCRVLSGGRRSAIIRSRTGHVSASTDSHSPGRGG